MKIEFAFDKDLDHLSILDKHIAKEELARLIAARRILVAKHDDKICGWLRFNLFWDSIPFINLIYVLEKFQKKGLGKELVRIWESNMMIQGYKKVMTSTLSNEDAQYFYRKLSYKDCGSLILPNEPLEILFIKEL